MTKKPRKKKTADPLASVSPETRAEIEQAFAALTAGIEAQRAEAKQWEGLKPFLDQASNAGKTLGEVLQGFVATEHYLREKPIDAMFSLCEQLGIDASEMARALIQTELGLARVLNPKSPKSDKSDLGGEGYQAPSFNPETILSAIDARLETVLRETEASEAIDSFKSDHPRFAELEPMIAGLLEKEIAEDLADAYAKAVLLKPAPAAAQAPAKNKDPAAQTRATIPAAQPALNTPDPAQTRKAKLSITGSPASGSDPATRKVPATTRDAVDKAFAQLGL